MTFRVYLLWTFVLLGRPQDLLPFLQPLRPALLLTALTLAMVIFGKGSQNLSNIFRTSIAKKFNILILIMIIGIPFAYHRKVAFDSVFMMYSVNVVFFYISILLVDNMERFKRLLTVILFCAFFYSFFSFIFGSFSQGRYFVYGGMFDPNDIAYVLVSLFPISFFFIAYRNGRLKRILALATIAFSMLIIVFTGSRAGILSLFTAISFFLIFNTQRIKSSYKIYMLLGIVAFFIFFSEKINIERYVSVFEISSDYNVTEEAGRLKIWERGFELLKMHPITGVGVSCFPIALGKLRAQLDLPPQWQATHNSYIQVAVETGLIGIIVFVFMIVDTLKEFLRQRTRKSGGIDAASLQTISTLMAISFISHLVAAFFITQGYSIFFTMFFMLSVIIHRMKSTLGTEVDTGPLRNSVTSGS